MLLSKEKLKEVLSNVLVSTISNGLVYSTGLPSTILRGQGPMLASLISNTGSLLTDDIASQYVLGKESMILSGNYAQFADQVIFQTLYVYLISMSNSSLPLVSNSPPFTN